MKELDVERLFEAAYQLPDGRRGHVQFVGCAHVAQVARHGFEGSQRIQVLRRAHAKSGVSLCRSASC
ncbi:hypothetical protein LMG29542_04310 [Paraburkholderia humisilvae]|uniref:Uncharacterized protein n=1 Tax=Paraburkholderia humisilvae TaxID=627669 RepID=A0A6J5E6X6_9BURK|nr:hypothetical protein LMG29542_04310 [Paraburkholderia humisilvae]